MLKNRRDRKYVYKFPPNVKLSLKPTSANMFVSRLHTNTFSNNSFVNTIYPPRVFYIQYPFLILQSSNTTYSTFERENYNTKEYAQKSKDKKINDIHSAIWYCFVKKILDKLVIKTSLSSKISSKKFHDENLPQNGTPSGVQEPSTWHCLRAGPRSSKPRSQEYVATVPSSSTVSFRRASSSSITSSALAPVNRTLLCAGAPG